MNENNPPLESNSTFPNSAYDPGNGTNNPMPAANNSQQIAEKKTSDNSTLIAVLLLIFLFPIGWLYMMFATKWSGWIKLVVTALAIIPILIIVMSIPVILAINPKKQIDRANEAGMAAAANKYCLGLNMCSAVKSKAVDCNSIEKINSATNSNFDSTLESIKIKTTGNVVTVTSSTPDGCAFACGYDFNTHQSLDVKPVDASKCKLRCEAGRCF